MCGESRTHGVDWGKRRRLYQNLTYRYFKRAAYGLIDYYLEEEKEMRLDAERTGKDETVLETEIDRMWGRVTLYNTYQLFVQLSSKKMRNPAAVYLQKLKNGEFDNLSPEELQDMEQEAYNKATLWNDKPEADLSTLYFNATAALPKNGMRTLVNNANSALQSMAGAEKMMASVYGIAITAMVRHVA